MNIQYYFMQNAKLGDEGKYSLEHNEKPYEQILKEKGFQDEYLRIDPGKDDLHPCFFYCMGKYTYYANLLNDIRIDMWHQSRYIRYLSYLLNKSSSQ